MITVKLVHMAYDFEPSQHFPRNMVRIETFCGTYGGFEPYDDLKLGINTTRCRNEGLGGERGLRFVFTPDKCCHTSCPRCLDSWALWTRMGIDNKRAREQRHE